MGWVALHYFGWFKYMAVLSLCSIKYTFLSLARVVSLKITRKLMRREWIDLGGLGELRRPLHANPFYSLWNLQKRCNSGVVNYQMQSLGVPFKNPASYNTSPNLFLRVCFLPQFLVTVGNLEKKNSYKGFASNALFWSSATHNRNCTV